MNEQEQQTPLVEAAVMMHELFTSLMDAGFNEMQALELTYKVMREGINNQEDDGGPTDVG